MKVGQQRGEEPEPILCSYCHRGEARVPPFVCGLCGTAIPGPLPARLWADPALLHSDIVGLRSGGRPSELPKTTTLTRKWSPSTRKRLRAWLKTAAPQNLAHLLRADPALIAHPMIYHQFLYLAGRGTEQIIRLGTSRESTKGAKQTYVKLTNFFIDLKLKHPLPRDLFKHLYRASSMLGRLITAWAEGLLPGWRVRLEQPKPRGRPTDPFAVLFLAVTFRALREELNHHRGLSSATADIQRLVGVLQALPRRDEPLFAAYVGGGLLYEGGEKRDPLPIEAARDIAEKALLRKKRNLKDRLVYGLLAYYEHKTPGQIEGRIRQARKLWPQLRSRKPRRRSARTRTKAATTTEIN